MRRVRKAVGGKLAKYQISHGENKRLAKNLVMRQTRWRHLNNLHEKNCSSIFASGYNFNTVEALKSTEEYNLIIKEYNIFLLNLKHYIYDDYFQVGECKSE